MKDLTNPKLIYAKGLLFLAGGLIGALVLFLDQPTVQTVLLLTLTVWCFSRFYYFAFYVIQYYVDPAYRFAGLGSFLRYLLRNR